MTEKIDSAKNDFYASLYTVKNPVTGLHEIKNLPAYKQRSFNKCPEPTKVVPYSHSPKFRLYLLTTRYLPINDLIELIP